MELPTREGSFDEPNPLNRVPLNDALEALDEFQRRAVLFALLNQSRKDGPSIVVAGGAVEAGMGVQSVETSDSHLLELVGYGFIDWDPESTRVSRGQNFEEIKPLLELLASREDELPNGWL